MALIARLHLEVRVLRAVVVEELEHYLRFPYLLDNYLWLKLSQT